VSTEEQLDECRTTAALYALGALAADEKSRFEQRLASSCPYCVSRLQEYAAVRDEIALSAPLKHPRASARDELLRRVEASAQNSNHADEMLIVRSNDTPWQRLPFPGVEVRPLLGDKTLLVRMQAGAEYPPHDHRQAEQCYVVEGSVTSSSGVTAYSGDFVRMPPGSHHDTIRTDTGCVFLIAYTA
jgi:anti-sigma factor ChrR (cupin superfamily)